MVWRDHYDDGEKDEKEDKITMCSAFWQEVFLSLIIDVHPETTGRCSD